MSRPPRIDHPGAWHHVINRGRRREPIFADDSECHLFMDFLTDAVERFGLQVHAYALMPNHYHLLVRSVRGNLSEAMAHLNGRYTRRTNKRHGWDGPLFKGRYRNQLLQDDTHLRYLLAYLHLNPVKARLVARPDEPSWTSHRAYLGLEEVPDFLTTTYLLDAMDGSAGVEAFVRDMHCGSRPWPAAMATASALLVDGDASRFPTRAQPVVPDALGAELVERLVCEITGASPEELRTVVRGPRANPARRFVVWALREGSSLPQAEIGRIVGMSSNQVAQVLRRLRPSRAPFREWIDRFFLMRADLDR